MQSLQEEKPTANSAHFVEQLQQLILIAQAILFSAMGQSDADEV